MLQLWALGRSARPDELLREGELAGEDFPYISSGDVQLSGRPVPPRPLGKDEIKEYIGLYAQAARNAVEGAGFDGVEIHSANGTREYCTDAVLTTTLQATSLNSSSRQ